MYAAFKAIQDTLSIRRLQAREMERDGSSTARLQALREDIASLERGLAALVKARSETDDSMIRDSDIRSADPNQRIPESTNLESSDWPVPVPPVPQNAPQTPQTAPEAPSIAP